MLHTPSGDWTPQASVTACARVLGALRSADPCTALNGLVVTSATSTPKALNIVWPFDEVEVCEAPSHGLLEGGPWARRRLPSDTVS